MCGCPMPMPIGPKGICERCWVEGPFHQQALREAPAAGRDMQHQAGDDLSRFEFTDWTKAWDEEPTEIQWLLAPLLERGTANVIYSDAGVGKSLVALESAASIAQTEHVLYVDSENRRRDHRDRLQAMGYTPEKLQNLHMLSFPDLPPLDKREGGSILLRLAESVSAVLVMIDTTMRFVDGKENDADTFNAMYKHTMLPLKGAGICSLRLDHEGKDSSKGQRGSSGKRGDVDSVWRLTHPQKGANRWLENEKDRSHHYPDKIRLELQFSPFGHAYRWNENYLDAEPQPRECNPVAILLESGVTADMTVRQARERVTASGRKINQPALQQALREIKDVTRSEGYKGLRGLRPTWERV
jgi:AAA domain